MHHKEFAIGHHSVHCLNEMHFPTVTCSGRCDPHLRKHRCVGVRQGQRGDCAGYGGRRDYRWRGRCRHIDSTDVVVAATGKRDANQALATSDCCDCCAVGLRKWHGLWCGDQAIMRRGVSGKGGRASWWWGLARVGAGCVLVGMGCVQMEKTEMGGRTDAAVWQPVKGLPSITKSCAAASSCLLDSSSLTFRFPILFFALCRRRTSREQILASAMRREAWRRMLTEQARARAAAARVLVAGRSLALPKLLAPRAGHCFGWHQDHVVEWLQYVCGPRTPDTRRICAHRERETSQSHRSILRGNGREDAHGCHQDVRTAPHHRREARAPRARPTSLVINRVQSTTLIASRCGGQVVQMHSWGASASRPSGGS